MGTVIDGVKVNNDTDRSVPSSLRDLASVLI